MITTLQNLRFYAQGLKDNIDILYERNKKSLKKLDELEAKNKQLLLENSALLAESKKLQDQIKKALEDMNHE